MRQLTSHMPASISSAKFSRFARRHWTRDYGIGFDGVANIWTAYLVGYMAGQFICSFIGRKLGPRLLLLGGLGASMAINVVFGFANSYATFLGFMLFNGLVQAAGWPGSVGGVAEWLRRKERGTIMGFWSTNYLVGNIVVKLLGGFLLLHFTNKYNGHYGVRYAFLGCTLVAFGIWWLIFFWQRSKPEDVGLDPIVDHEHPADRAVISSTKEHISFREFSWLILNPIVPLMGLAYFSIKFLRYALDSWLPTFLDLQGMNVGEAAYYSSIFDWAGLAGAIVAGIALDRIFRSRWEIVCLIMGLEWWSVTLPCCNMGKTRWSWLSASGSLALCCTVPIRCSAELELSQLRVLGMPWRSQGWSMESGASVPFYRNRLMEGFCRRTHRRLRSAIRISSAF